MDDSQRRREKTRDRVAKELEDVASFSEKPIWGRMLMKRSHLYLSTFISGTNLYLIVSMIFSHPIEVDRAGWYLHKRKAFFWFTVSLSLLLSNELWRPTRRYNATVNEHLMDFTQSSYIVAGLNVRASTLAGIRWMERFNTTLFFMKFELAEIKFWWIEENRSRRHWLLQNLKSFCWAVPNRDHSRHGPSSGKIRRV